MTIRIGEKRHWPGELEDRRAKRKNERSELRLKWAKVLLPAFAGVALIVGSSKIELSKEEPKGKKPQPTYSIVITPRQELQNLTAFSTFLKKVLPQVEDEDEGKKPEPKKAE